MRIYFIVLRAIPDVLGLSQQSSKLSTVRLALGLCGDFDYEFKVHTFVPFK